MQISPKANQVGNTVPILTGATLSGQDAFAGNAVELVAPAVDTSLTSDVFADGKGEVVE